MTSPAPAPSTETPRESTWSVIRDSLRGVPQNYTRGSISRAVFLLAVPMVLEMVMESLFSVVDTFFVGKLGSDAVAIVGLTFSWVTILFAIAIGLCIGTTAMVARRIGEGDIEGARKTAVQAIIAGVVISVPLGLAGAYWSEELLLALGAEAALADYGSGFAAILLGGNVTLFLLFLINAVFRGAGEPAIAMRALWIGNGCNMLLDPILIFGLGPAPELGLEGAAIATVIGRGIGVLYQFWALSGRAAAQKESPSELLEGQTGTRQTILGLRSRLALRRADWVFDPPRFLRLFRISAIGILQFLIGTASWIFMMRLMAKFGSEALAGYTIAIRVIIFVLLPAWGVANAAATLVGQNLGAKQPDRAEKSVWMTCRVNAVFMAIVTVIFMILAAPIVRIFSLEPEVVRVGTRCLMIVSSSYICFAFGMTTVQAFNGSGDTTTPTWINLIAYWAVQIPVAYLLSQVLGWGPDGVFIAICLSQVTLAGIAVFAFRRGKWKSSTA